MSHKYTWNSHDPYDSYYTTKTTLPSTFLPTEAPTTLPQPKPPATAATPHEYGNDDAPDSGYNDYGNSPGPEPHEVHDDELSRRAAEYGMTPQELQEISRDCIHEQEILEQEYQEEMREAREAQREAMRSIREAEELEYRAAGRVSKPKHR